MSKSVARQHLKLLLQRTALVDATAKAQEEALANAAGTSSKKRKISETEQTGPKANDGKGIMNPFVQAVDDFHGSSIEITRQVKKAKRIINKVSAKPLEATEKQKRTSVSNNLQALLRTSSKKEVTGKKMEAVSTFLRVIEGIETKLYALWQATFAHTHVLTNFSSNYPSSFYSAGSR